MNLHWISDMLYKVHYKKIFYPINAPIHKQIVQINNFVLLCNTIIMYLIWRTVCTLLMDFMCLYHYYSETLNKGHAHRGLVILSIIERLQSCSKTFLLTHKVIHMDLLLSNKKWEGLVDFYDVEWKSIWMRPERLSLLSEVKNHIKKRSFRWNTTWSPVERLHSTSTMSLSLWWSLYLLEISMNFISLPVSLSLCQKTMGRWFLFSLSPGASCVFPLPWQREGDTSQTILFQHCKCQLSVKQKENNDLKTIDYCGWLKKQKWLRICMYFCVDELNR